MAIHNEAEAQIASALPKAPDRKLVMARLIRSIDIANAIAPNAWACTLLPSGFRLNVGQVEVMWVLEDGYFRVNLAPTPKFPSFEGNRFASANYASQPSPQFRFGGTVREYTKNQEAIDAGQDAFVRNASRSPSGNPVKGTRFSKSHCEPLVAYARQVAG